MIITHNIYVQIKIMFSKHRTLFHRFIIIIEILFSKLNQDFKNCVTIINILKMSFQWSKPFTSLFGHYLSIKVTTKEYSQMLGCQGRGIFYFISCDHQDRLNRLQLVRELVFWSPGKKKEKRFDGFVRNGLSKPPN